MDGKLTLACIAAALSAVPILIAADGRGSGADAARAVGNQRRAWAKPPIRQCVTDMVFLARFEHRARTCTATVLKDDGTTAAIDYSCGVRGSATARSTS